MDLHELDKLTDEECAALLFDGDFLLRGQQKIPIGNWNIWIIICGRGWGKNFSISHNVKNLIRNQGYKRIAFVGPTTRDVNKTMVLGESGLLNAYGPWEQPNYVPSNTRVFCENGAVIDLFESYSPDRIRGGNFDLAVLDEWAAHKDPQYVLDMMSMALRFGPSPKMIITTTPRGIKPLRKLLTDAEDPANGIIVTRGSTYDNQHNLPEMFLQQIKRTYEGTRIGRQEIYGEVLIDDSNSLFKAEDIDAVRIRNKTKQEVIEACRRIVVAIDPAVTSNTNSDETGIVVVGQLDESNGVVFEDATFKGTPQEWAAKAVELYDAYNADRIIAEVNNGGDLVENTIRMVSRYAAYSSVRATRGKQVRAEPIGALYEQHRIQHFGYHAKLEEQMTEWVPGEGSPDRMDALVWGLTELFINPGVLEQGLLQMSY